MDQPNDAPSADALSAYRKRLVKALPPATRKLAAALLTKLLEQNERQLRIALVAQAISAREKA